ncbi:hypothetical protein QQF64_033960 [Cirrhinus molitorella]|uniref:PiggyBac transposable element-derived protein domain-containing protein n=1 Tax=Cirrhinus molitorella TaxID=172907 RepID=A0ABR3MVG3_9TELE
MSRDCFFQLRSNLHVVNNYERPPGDTDVFFKVRPLYECIRKCCLQLHWRKSSVLMSSLCLLGENSLCSSMSKGNLHHGESRYISSVAKVGLLMISSSIKRIQAPNHKIFFDYFTFNLLEVLAKKKIHAAGTAKVCRLANPPLKTDKEMSKKERVKWFDNRSVVLASNFVGVRYEDEVQRWDQKEKQYAKIKRPEVGKKYNKAMGRGGQAGSTNQPLQD